MSPRTNRNRLRNGFIFLAVVIFVMVGIALLVNHVQAQSYKALGEQVR